MIRNLLNICIYIIIGIIIPLSGAWHLIVSPQMMSVIFFMMVMLLSQPVMKIEKTTQHADTDRGSFYYILVCSLISIIVCVSDWAYRHDGYTTTLLKVIGLICIVSGIAYRTWAIQTLGRFFTSKVEVVTDHALITDGPYKYLRHPSYTGAYITFLGMAIFLGSWLGLIATMILMGIAYQKRIDAEENTLITYFGNVYIDYAKNSYKLIPGIW